jgi:hypothetical protein
MHTTKCAPCRLHREQAALAALLCSYWLMSQCSAPGANYHRAQCRASRVFSAGPRHSTRQLPTGSAKE